VSITSARGQGIAVLLRMTETAAEVEAQNRARCAQRVPCVVWKPTIFLVAASGIWHDLVGAAPGLEHERVQQISLQATRCSRWSRPRLWHIVSSYHSDNLTHTILAVERVLP
jgi:hypothetical protein